jgi:hypothetical protein
MQMPGMGEQPSETTKMGTSKGITKMASAAAGEVFAQRWDDQKEELARMVVTREAAEIDLEYDALLANRRTLDA